MLKNFICPTQSITPITTCLKKCPFGERCAPLSYLRLCSEEREWTGKPSVTQLIRGTREVYLKIKHDYSINPQDQVFRIIGSKGHLSLEQYGLNPEEKLEYAGITGIPDEIETEDINILIDNKVSGSYKIMRALGIVSETVETGEFFKNGNPKTKKEFIRTNESTLKNFYDEWSLQTNMYRIMFEKKTGLRIDKIKIFAPIRDGNTTSAKSRGLFNNFEYIEVPIQNDEQVLKYFMAKKNQLLSALENNKIPEPCSPEEAWNGNKCRGYCPVVEHCDSPYL